MNGQLFSNSVLKTFILVVTFAGYSCLLYFIPRTNFYSTFFLILVLFACYYFTVKKKHLFSFGELVVVGIVVRAIALFNTPVLSDDFYRFIWDGEMWVRHVSPFAYTPDDYMANHTDTYLKYLHDQMNSGEYYSVYPAVLQYIFGLAAKISAGSVYAAILVLKSFIFLSECATGFLLFKYMKFKKLDVYEMHWYFLNPLIILELLGNIHFESLLILFLIATLYFLEKNKFLKAGVFWGFAICTKFLPLMLAPLFLRYLGFRRFIQFGTIAVICCVLLFIPFIDSGLMNIQDSVGKFYDLFEFNASVYYFINEVAAYFFKSDIADQLAAGLGILSLICIILLSFIRFKNDLLIERSLFIFSIYFLFTTMVHPWYISTVVAFSCLIRYRYAMVFSCLVFLSYFPYSLKNYEENKLVILLEYSVLFLYVLYEFRLKQRNKREVDYTRI